MRRTQWAIAFCLCAGFCSAQHPSGSGSAKEEWTIVETFKYRPAARGSVERTFILEASSHPDMPESFTRLRIQTPGQREFVLLNEYAWWIKPKSHPTWFSNRKNAVGSDYIFGLPLFARGVRHTLLFFVGWAFGSAPGSLHIVDIQEGGARPPSLVLKREELEFGGVQDLDGDGTPEVIGAPCMTQTWGDHFLTYDPVHVFVLRSQDLRAELSIPLSKAYNERHYYGWVGPDCSEDWAVVLHPPGNGKPVIMRSADAERLQRKPRQR